MEQDLEKINQLIDGALDRMDRAQYESATIRAQIAQAMALVALCDRLDKMSISVGDGYRALSVVDADS